MISFRELTKGAHAVGQRGQGPRSGRNAASGGTDFFRAERIEAAEKLGETAKSFTPDGRAYRGQSEREENHGADQASCPCGPGLVWKGVFTPFHGRVFEGGANRPSLMG